MSTLAPIAPPSRSRPARGPNWLRSPQRVWLRRAVFQVHLWLGVVLTLYAVVIGLSGAVLVFRPELERHLTPQLFHLQPQARQTTLAATVAMVQQARPGWRVSSLENLAQPDQALLLLLRPAAGALQTNYRIVAVNPYTGAVLADKMRFAGALGCLTNLHFYLLAGKTGLRVSGWMALALLLLCLTGLVVWWPGVQRWRSAVMLRPHIRWRRLNWDVHSVVGFWFSGSLLLLCCTGLYFAFPQPVARVMATVVGEARPAGARLTTPAPVAQRTPATGRPMPLDAALLAAQRALPAAAPPDYMALPARPGSPFYATGYYAGSAPYAQLVSVTLDPVTGAVRTLTDTRQQGRAARWIQMFFALHFGSFAEGSVWSLPVKGLWVLAGLSPALLALTGLVMFWNRSVRPKLLQRRRRAHQRAVPR